MSECQPLSMINSDGNKTLVKSCVIAVRIFVKFRLSLSSSHFHFLWCEAVKLNETFCNNKISVD